MHPSHSETSETTPDQRLSSLSFCLRDSRTALCTFGTHSYVRFSRVQSITGPVLTTPVSFTSSGRQRLSPGYFNLHNIKLLGKE